MAGISQGIYGKEQAVKLALFAFAVISPFHKASSLME
jgi:hypothetical protein